MASKLLTSSGAFATSGSNTRVKNITVVAVGGIGQCQIKSGGSGGTAVTADIRLLENTSIHVPLPVNTVGDYAALTNAHVLVEFTKGA